MNSSEPPATRSGERASPPAVVIGLDSITGLQTARILAARGVRVFGLVADRRHWGAHTNSCVEVLQSRLSGDELIESLVRLADRVTGRAVLFPCTDPSVDTVSLRRSDLGEKFVLPLSPHPVVELLMDKVRLARHAAAAGLPVPRTEVLSNRSDAVAVADDLTYPCVLKPPVKAATWLARTSAKGFAVNGPAHLLSVYDTVSSWAPALLAQEWVVGPETGLYSCNAYFVDGRPLASFVARKIRQWPPEIGTSASGEECRNDEVLATTLRLFGDVGFHGLGYLEMKRDVRSGRLMIIEPNVGRPTGRSAIAEAGGVELVFTAYCEAVGLPLPEARQQRYGGAKWVDLRRDLQAAIVARRSGTLSTGEWLAWMRGPKAHAIWSVRDPKPFLVDAVHAATSTSRLLQLMSRRPAGVVSNAAGRPVLDTPGQRGT